ncbi:MAG: addiction module protein [Phycisphaeraceae bacterium]
MPATKDQLKSHLSDLPVEDRAELAQFLIDSLDGDQGQTDAAFDAELARRVEEIEQGRASGEPADQVITELRTA